MRLYASEAVGISTIVSVNVPMPSSTTVGLPSLTRTTNECSFAASSRAENINATSSALSIFSPLVKLKEPLSLNTRSIRLNSPASLSNRLLCRLRPVSPCRCRSLAPLRIPTSLPPAFSPLKSKSNKPP